MLAGKRGQWHVGPMRVFFKFPAPDRFARDLLPPKKVIGTLPQEVDDGLLFVIHARIRSNNISHHYCTDRNYTCMCPGEKMGLKRGFANEIWIAGRCG